MNTLVKAVVAPLIHCQASLLTAPPPCQVDSHPAGVFAHAASVITSTLSLLQALPFPFDDLPQATERSARSSAQRQADTGSRVKFDFGARNELPDPIAPLDQRSDGDTISLRISSDPYRNETFLHSGTELKFGLATLRKG